MIIDILHDIFLKILVNTGNIIAFPVCGQTCAQQHKGATAYVRRAPSLCQPSAPAHPGGVCTNRLSFTPAAWHGGEKAGWGGETQMRAESLHRAVSQTLVERQELMNAARSQCVAQQLQLHSTHYLTEAALKARIIIKKKTRQEWPTKYNKQILQRDHYSTVRNISPSSVCSCVLLLGVCE